MQPEMLSPNEKELRALEEIRPSRDRVDERVFEENNEEVVDDNVRNLIIRLSSSTARGAFLANRLADIHRRIATGPSLSGNNENWFSNQAEEDEDTETDLVPRDEEDEDELTVPSPEIQSDIEEVPGLEHDDNDIATPITSEEGEMSRPASVDSLVLAIDEAINILDPVNSHPQLSSFLSVSSDGPPVAERRPSFLPEDDEDDDDDDNDLIAAVGDLPPADLAPASSETSGGSSHPAPTGPADGSTAVTRYLIKHLPKQLTQLRYVMQSLLSSSKYFILSQEPEA